jgi:hypothetical protein
MRKIDRKNNFKKANLMAEQKYLESKGLIKESLDMSETTPIYEESPVDIASFKDEYTRTLYRLEHPYLKGKDEELQTIINIYKSHIQALSNILSQNQGKI